MEGSAMRVRRSSGDDRVEVPRRGGAGLWVWFVALGILSWAWVYGIFAAFRDALEALR